MTSPFDDPDGLQATDPVAASWELFDDVRHKPPFDSMPRSAWQATAAPIAIARITGGWRILDLYAAITARLPSSLLDGHDDPAQFAATRLRGVPEHPDKPYEFDDGDGWY